MVSKSGVPHGEAHRSKGRRGQDGRGQSDSRQQNPIIKGLDHQPTFTMHSEDEEVQEGSSGLLVQSCERPRRERR